jgi:uncharacterized protein YdaU (DUF1376 family)
MSTSLPNLFMMPWFPRDFLAATRGWRLIPRAIYRELLDAQWEQGGLPADPGALRILIGATPAEWRSGWLQVEPKFPLDADGLRRNRRLEQHREKAIQIAQRRAESGRLGGHAKAARSVANARQMPEPVSGNCLASTQHNTQEAYGGGGDVLGEYLRSTDPSLLTDGAGVKS